MLYVLLTILSSLAIALLLKFNEHRQGERILVAGANYIVASILGFLLAGERLSLEAEWLGFAVLVGGGFVAGFLLLMKSIRSTGLAITASVARTATLGPILLSVLIYNEHPTLVTTLGIVLGLVAFLFLGISQRDSQRGNRLHVASLLLLGLLFCVMTFNDFSMKIAQVNQIEKGVLLFFLFGSAALICWGMIGYRMIAGKNRLTFNRRDLLLGAVLGIPNCLNSWFMIRALQEVPASVVFPIVSAGGVIATTLAAVLFWREELSRPAWIGIGLATIAVILLGI